MFNKTLFQDIVAVVVVLLIVLITVFPIPSLFYSAIAISLFFIRDPLVVFPAYFVASLSNTYFGLSNMLDSGGMSAGRFLSPILIISLLFSILRQGQKIKTKIFPFVLFFIAYCLFSCLISVTGSLTPFIIIIQSLLVLLLFPMLVDVDIERLYRLVWISSMLVLLGILLYVVRAGGIEILLYDRFKKDGDINSNRIAMMCAQIGVAILSPLFANKSRFIKLSSIAGYVITFTLTFFTGSRTGLIAIFSTPIIMFFIIYSNGTATKHKSNHGLLLLLLFAFVLYVVVSKLGDLDTKVVSRYTLESVEETGGSGRMSAISVMWNDVFPKYPIFGVGLGGANFVAVSQKYGVTHPCHNIILDSLCQLGIVGFVIFVILVVEIFFPCIKSLRKENNSILILPMMLFIAAFVNGIGESIYVEKFFWNALTLCLVFANRRKQINGTI